MSSASHVVTGPGIAPSISRLRASQSVLPAMVALALLMLVIAAAALVEARSAPLAGEEGAEAIALPVAAG